MNMVIPANTMWQTLGKHIINLCILSFNVYNSPVEVESTEKQGQILPSLFFGGLGIGNGRRVVQLGTDFKFTITSKDLPLWSSGEGCVLLAGISGSGSNIKVLSRDRDLVSMFPLTLEKKENVL